MNINEDYFKTKEPIKQNTIEDILEPNEKILQRLKPNKKVVLLESMFKGMPIALLWAAIDITVIVIMISSGAFVDEPGLIWFIIPFFAIHLLPLWIYIAGIVKAVLGVKNVEYVFTDKRIIIRSGIIGIDFKTIYYSDVQGINCRVGIFDRLFKVGDLYIKAYNQSAVLMNIEAPYFFLSKLQKITLDIKTDIEYPNDLRPRENHGYQTTYKPDDDKVEK